MNYAVFSLIVAVGSGLPKADIVYVYKEAAGARISVPFRAMLHSERK